MTTKDERRNRLHTQIFIWHAVLIVGLTFFLTATGVLVNIATRAKSRDHNLMNLAQTVANSTAVRNLLETRSADAIKKLDSFCHDALDLDAVSIVDANGIRRYHTNHQHIDTPYDGDFPDFSNGRRRYAIDSIGPSGWQRRAFSAIYDDEGNYLGFAITFVLSANIRNEALKVLALFLLFAALALVVEFSLSYKITNGIKARLLGLEPQVFSEMFEIRENILEALEEGVVMCDANGETQFVNKAAKQMFGEEQDLNAVSRKMLGVTLATGLRETHVAESARPGSCVLVDRLPFVANDKIVGALGVLHDRTEYMKLAEDLTGTKFLVDSMRANAHDFTNKLHVVLGLIQMEQYKRAAEYIENVTFVQRECVGAIVKAIDDPTLAALLIGKTSKAAELNIQLILAEGSVYRRADVSLPSDAVVTILGNLVTNALEAMNDMDKADEEEKTLIVDVHTQPGSLLLIVEDSGPGIPADKLEKIFAKGYTTKGEERGNGLYQVKNLIESLGGKISVESTEGAGTSFSVIFQRSAESYV